MMCEECELFEIGEIGDCCRVCFSVRRGIPLDHMTDDEFASFRHRMRKEQKKIDEENRQKKQLQNRMASSAHEAWQKVLDAEARGDYADGIKGCATCKQIFKPHEKYCVACARKALAAAGIPGHSAK
jgi:hypothetical protein